MKTMVKSLIACVALFSATMTQAQNKPQIPNGDFETWSYDGDNLPNNWNSFQTAGGQYASMGYSANNRQVMRSSEVRPGSEGTSSVVIWARSVVGVVAQGNLTTGRVNAGSMSATNVANYNISDREKVNTNNGVDNPCAMKFNGKPDSVALWVKFVPAKAIADAPYAKFSAIIHGDYDYISYGLPENDTEENQAQVVAKSEVMIEAKDSQWQRLVLPFEYTENTIEPAYIQLNASTNATPGKGTKNDSLYIDDIELIYAEAPAPVYYHVNVTAESLGTVSIDGEIDGDSILMGKTITITAVAKEGCHFTEWSDGNKFATRTIKVTDNINLVAKFEEVTNEYTPIAMPEDEAEEALPIDPYYEVSINNPMEMTDSIVNPAFQNGKEGWTVKANGMLQSAPELTIGGNDSSKNGEMYAEAKSGIFAYTSSFVISQNIKNLPNGIYRASVQAFYRDGSIEQSLASRKKALEGTGKEALHTQFFANNVKKFICSIYDDAQKEALSTDDAETELGNIPNNQASAAAYFDAGCYEVVLDSIVVTNGTINIGLEKDGTKGTSSWACFTNFMLAYCGEDGEDHKIVPAQLNATFPEVAEGDTITYDVLHDETTDTVKVAFSYTDRTPAAGWKYACLYLTDNDTTIALGYTALDSTLAVQDITGLIPNNIESGEYELMVTVGKSEDLIKSVPVIVNVHEREYSLTYIVGEDTLHTDTYEAYSPVTPFEAPEKEGYTFNGWDNVPETMPAENTVITGSYTVNVYSVTYMNDEEVLHVDSVAYGEKLPTYTAPEKEGYTFSGWDNVPETMPAKDTTVNGTYTVNVYSVTYMKDEMVLHVDSVAYGKEIPAYEYEAQEGETFIQWVGDTYETMPAKDIVYVADITSGMSTTTSEISPVEYYTLDGVRIAEPRKGMNIIRMSDGTIIKRHIY